MLSMGFVVRKLFRRSSRRSGWRAATGRVAVRNSRFGGDGGQRGCGRSRSHDRDAGWEWEISVSITSVNQERPPEIPWINLIIGHGMPLLRWRSAGVKRSTMFELC